MANRNRIPTVFSIYMLDVICCALGCVILLWQLSNMEAEQQTEAAQKGEEAARLALARWRQANSEVDSATAEIESLRAALLAAQSKDERLSIDLARTTKQRDNAKQERDEANRVITLRKKEYDALRDAWLLSEAMLKGSRGDLEKLRDQHKLATLDLATKIKTNAELLLQISAADKKTQALAKLTGVQTIDAQEAAKRLQEQLARLQNIELKNKDLDKQAGELRATRKDALNKAVLSALRVKVLEQDLDKARKDLVASGDQISAFQKQLGAVSRAVDDTKATIAGLQGEKALLSARVRAIQAEADQRFAGIALTGKNVLFLVDMSGSMAMTDESTLDPEKWPLVCETVAQLMRSLKDLQFYQVLLFSDKVRYPMGKPATWLRYNPTETPKQVAATLKTIKPEGETNMYAVFAEAFRYREAALDTIYVLSDGLPNAGEGLPTGADKLSENERNTILSKHLRNKLKNDWNRPLATQKRVRINSIGYFFESPDVGAFLWALSREHDGSFVGMSK
jgi:hypothetical protein